MTDNEIERVEAIFRPYDECVIKIFSIKKKKTYFAT